MLRARPRPRLLPFLPLRARPRLVFAFFLPALPVNVLSLMYPGLLIAFSPTGQANDFTLSRNCDFVHHFATRTIMYSV